MAWMIGTPYVATPKLYRSHYAMGSCLSCTDAGRVSVCKSWELGGCVWLEVPPLKGLPDFLARAGVMWEQGGAVIEGCSHVDRRFLHREESLYK